MPQAAPRGSAARLIKWAAALQLVQGVVMEGLPFIGLGVLLLLGTDASVMSPGFSFIVPFFNEHLSLMMAMSGIFTGGALVLLLLALYGDTPIQMERDSLLPRGEDLR